MSDHSQEGPKDPNAPGASGAPGEQSTTPPREAKPFYLRPPFMAGAAVAIVAIVAIAFIAGPSGKQGDSPQAKAQTANDAEEAVSASGWELGRPGDIVMGSPDAPVKLVEYASMTCGHCAAFEISVFPHIKKKYIDTGLVQFTMREFPTPPVSLSVAGFMLARCAGQDRYYQALEALFRTQPLWIKPDPKEARSQLEKISRQFGLNGAEFEACIENEEELERIRTVTEAGHEVFGINSTPSFVINGRKAEMRGATFEALDSLIQEHLPEGTEVPDYSPPGGDQPANDEGAAEDDGSADETADDNGEAAADEAEGEAEAKGEAEGEAKGEADESGAAEGEAETKGEAEGTGEGETEGEAEDSGKAEGEAEGSGEAESEAEDKGAQ